MQSNDPPQAASNQHPFGNPRGIFVAIACAVALAVALSAGVAIRQRGGHSHAAVTQQSTHGTADDLQPGTADFGSEQILVPASTLPKSAAVPKVATIYLVGSQNEADALQARLDDLQQFVIPGTAGPDLTILVVSTAEEQANARLAIKQAQLDFGESNVRVDDMRTPSTTGDAPVGSPIAPTDTIGAPSDAFPDGCPCDIPANLTRSAAVPARGGQSEAIIDPAPVPLSNE